MQQSQAKIYSHLKFMNVLKYFCLSLLFWDVYAFWKAATANWSFNPFQRLVMANPVAEMNFFSNPEELKSALMEQAHKVFLRYLIH